MAAIGAAIRASEATHTGEIRFAVEGALDGGPLFAGQSARGRAIDVFSQLRVWDTADNNGVLIYLLLAAHENQISGSNGLSSLSGATHMILGSDKLHLHGKSSVLRESEANKTDDNEAAILLFCS